MASICSWTSDLTLSRYSTFSAERVPSERSARSASYACISTPISKPRLLLAVELSEAPVPPSAIATSVIPITEPPVIVTLSAFCSAIVPRLSVMTKFTSVSLETYEPRVSKAAYCVRSGRLDRSL